MKPNSSGNKGTNFSIYTKNLPNKKNLLDRLNHLQPSCSAQTLRRVSSLDKELRSRNNFKQNLLLEYI